MFKPNKSNFRNSNNQLYTRRLFVEESYTANDKTSVTYTLSDQDHPSGYPSLFKLYMEEADPTEFRFAERYLDSYDHWVLITETTWFKPYLERWRATLEQKLRSQAVDKVMQVAQDDTHKSQFEAVKILLNCGWKSKEPRYTDKGRGRPSKVEIKNALDSRVSEEEELSRELKRLAED